MKRTLWQIAIAVRAVYGVNLTAHSNEAPHSKKPWGYPYVDYPIANTFEADPMADSHSSQSSVWSRVNLTAHSNEVPHSKKLWGYPYVEFPIASTYVLKLFTARYRCTSTCTKNKKDACTRIALLTLHYACSVHKY